MTQTQIIEQLLDQNSRFLKLIETYQQDKIEGNREHSQNMKMLYQMISDLGIQKLWKSLFEVPKEATTLESILLPPGYKLIIDAENMFSFVAPDGFTSGRYNNFSLNHMISLAYDHYEEGKNE